MSTNFNCPGEVPAFTSCVVQKLAPTFGRILLAAIFLGSGVGKIGGGFAQTASYMESKGMIFAQFFLVGAIVFELAGGLSLLTGFLTRWGALLLIVFLVPTTIIFHNVFVDPAQQINFMKNVAIVGGLLMVVHAGPGPWSIDGMFCKCKGGKSAIE